MLYKLVGLPTLLSCIIFVGASISIAISGLLLVKKLFPRITIRGEQIRPAAAIASIVGAMVAILFAFVVVTVWQRYNEQNNRIVSEASMLGNLYRDSKGLNKEEEKCIQELIKKYTQSLVADAWPLLAEGKESRKAWEDFNNLYIEIIFFNPVTEREKIILAGMVSTLNELASYRRIRLLHSTTPIIPTVLWYILTIGALISICLTYFFRIGPLSIQVLFTSLHATILSLIIFFTILLNFPYKSSIKVKPDPIRNLLEDVYPIADLRKDSLF